MSRSLYAQLSRRHGPKVDALTRREMLKATLDALEDVEEPADEAETEPDDDASDGPVAAEAA